MRLRISKLGVGKPEWDTRYGGATEIVACLKWSHETYGVIVNDSLSTKLDCKSILTGEEALRLTSKDDQ